MLTRIIPLLISVLMVFDISSLLSDSLKPEFFYTVQNYDNRQKILSLTNGSRWNIGWLYTGIANHWKQGDRLKISYHSFYANYNYMKFENVDSKETAWGTLRTLPSILDSIQMITQNRSGSKNILEIALRSGLTFSFKESLIGWTQNDKVLVLHSSSSKNLYGIWNLSKKTIILDGFQLLKNEMQDVGPWGFSFEKVIRLEELLNKRVLGQPEATKMVASAMLNCCFGLKDPNRPIAVFLFLGPPGVGKTELAKALAEELYHNRDQLIRFDMNHFTEHYEITRLIGSPPGYVNHEEGGQFTEALLANPQSIVLLDEIEKAHPMIQKAFLQVFDEGYIYDAKNNKVNCKDAIFIMTSNLFTKDVITAVKKGYTSKEILDLIEPQLIHAISPELYSRVEPVLFFPLEEETLSALVDMLLDKLIVRIKEVKEIHLIFDPSVKEFLMLNGYHPTSGARPLKNLIERTIITTVARAIITQNIPKESTIMLSYDLAEDEWHVEMCEESHISCALANTSET